MYPYYTGYKPGFDLNPDDIFGIKSIYGEKTVPVTTTTTTETTEKDLIPPFPITTTTTTKAPTTTTTTTATTTTEKEIIPPWETTKTTTTTLQPIATKAPSTKRKCPRTMDVEAMYYSNDEEKMVAFTKRRQIVSIGDNDFTMENVNNVISRRQLRGKVDAAASINRLDGDEVQIYFSGKKYYVFKDLEKISGPHSFDSSRNNPLKIILSSGKGKKKKGKKKGKKGHKHHRGHHKDSKYRSKVKKIDAAFASGNKMYLFSGDYYWRYNIDRKRMDSGYPRNLNKRSKGLPRKINAAFKTELDGQIFFLTKYRYYAVDKSFRVTSSGSIKKLLNCL